MHYFINSLLYDCGVVAVMKKMEIHHPKLYLTAERNDTGQIEATFASNRFAPSGKLIEQVIVLDGVDVHIGIENILIDLNKVEFKKLDIFISRQEKVVQTYKSKGKSEQFRIVSDSLDLLFELRSTFENWFDEMECTV
jgi:predicted membrane protein